MKAMRERMAKAASSVRTTYSGANKKKLLGEAVGLDLAVSGSRGVSACGYVISAQCLLTSPSKVPYCLLLELQVYVTKVVHSSPAGEYMCIVCACVYERERVCKCACLYVQIFVRM